MKVLQQIRFFLLPPPHEKFLQSPIDCDMGLCHDHICITFCTLYLLE